MIASTATMIASTATAAASNIDFAREIRPILSDHCFTCHGPDANKRKGDLRLDLKDSAFGQAESGASAIVPGHPEMSELVKRITSTDPDEVMPPPGESKLLKPEQADLLKRWVEQGAVWTGHWSFEPVKSIPVPESAAPNPIDAFVHSRLAAEGLAPAPEEEPAR